jgi:hypothetical protein
MVRDYEIGGKVVLMDVLAGTQAYYRGRETHQTERREESFAQCGTWRFFEEALIASQT